MRLPKVLGGRKSQPSVAMHLSRYKVGQRTVELLQLVDGHVQWVCNCEDFLASTSSACGAWCKHVAKASAIRSIERLTGARQVTRTTSLPRPTSEGVAMPAARANELDVMPGSPAPLH